MPIAATSAALIPATERSRPRLAGATWFSRVLTAIMAARAAEAERIVAQLMDRRGLHAINGEWTASAIQPEPRSRA